MTKEKPTKRSAAQQGARAMARARWAKVPPEERHRLMTKWGKLGGRPKSERRCFCGKVTMERALSRGFDCCRQAGALKLSNGAMGILRESLAAKPQVKGKL